MLPRASQDWSQTLPAAISSLTVYFPMDSLCLAITHHCAGGDPSTSSCLRQSGCCSPACCFDETILSQNLFERLQSISFSRASMEHPESTYLEASANHFHRSLVFESSFSFNSVIFQFRWQLKVPSCSLFCPPSLAVLTLEVVTEVTETESNSVSSKEYPDWSASSLCPEFCFGLQGSCQLEAELFLSRVLHLGAWSP